MKFWLPLVRTRTGSEVYTRRLAEGLAANGHSVVLDEVPHHFQYYPWFAPLRAPKDVDVIVANSWNASAFRRPGIPLITVLHHVVHDPDNERFKSLAQSAFHRLFVKRMEASALELSDRVIAVSQTTKEAIKRFISDVPVTVVLNGVDTEFFRPNEPTIEQGGNKPLKLLFVGKPSRRKGFDLVARIVERLQGHVSLTCVGPEPTGSLPRPPARYLGWLDPEKLLTAYREADLLLFPSRLEGFGYVAAEALACGVPVVSTKGTAVAEIAPPPDCGLACEPENVDDFVYAILGICIDRIRLQSMRCSARAHAVAHLDANRWISEMENELELAIKAPTRTRRS